MDSPGWKETARTERTTRNLGCPADREPANGSGREREQITDPVGSRESERLIVARNSGNAGGAKGP